MPVRTAPFLRSLFALLLFAVGAVSCTSVCRTVGLCGGGSDGYLSHTRGYSPARDLSLALAFDSSAIGPGDDLGFRVQLRNERNEPRELILPSGQVFDLELRDARGEVLRRWSDDRMFTMALVSVQLEPRGERVGHLGISLEGLQMESTYNVVATVSPTGGDSRLETRPFPVHTQSAP